MGRELLIHNARLVDRDGDALGAILVRDGKIAARFEGVDSRELALSAARDPDSVETVDARGAAVMPAFVDLHAHFRDPGFTKKEDLESASRAASAGGYGTVVLMANTNPVISSEADARAVNERVRAIGLVESFQSVSLTRAFDGKDTSALESLNPRAVPIATEDGREVASAATMLAAMGKCARTGVVVSCHCEDPELAAAAKPYRERALKLAREGGLPPGKLSAPGGELSPEVRENLSEAGRLLRLAEDTMTARNLALALASGCRVHVAHVSTAGALDEVRLARERESAIGATSPSRITCEATPHHLSLDDSLCEIVNPPLRAEADREALIAGILDGTIDAIATDHAPHTAEDKAAGAPGFSGIQIAFATCNTALVKTGRVSLSKLSELMSANPARILGLDRGALRVGLDADLVLVDLDASFTVDVSARTDSATGFRWLSRGINTPFAGKKLYGVALATYKAGRIAYERE